MRIAPTVVEGWGTAPPPLHYILYDRSGASIVVEPLSGRLEVRDNPLGVLTNSPQFDWHMTNLRNYMGLRPDNPAPVSLGRIQLAPLGQGVGLPGDFSPPSRFVRAAIFSLSANKAPTSWDGVRQVFHILNNFDIPLGAVRDRHDDMIAYDFTQMTSRAQPRLASAAVSVG